MIRIPLPILPAITFCLVLAGMATADAQVVFSSPSPGEVYRESAVTFSTGNDDWRVTDPNVNLTWYPQAAAFLPNPTISFTIDDLSDAVRAEAVITVWGGHPGTTGKQLRFNGNSWITIPELNSSNGIPAGSDGQCFLSQYNVVVPVPIGNLQTGTNTVQGNSGGQTCYSFQWGQWGWYGMIVRVYYSSSKPHTEGTIISHSPGQTIGESTVLSVGNLTGSVSRVDYLAYYDGNDTDGDGIYLQYHHDYHRDQGESMTIKNHAGTGTSGPSYSATWNATWVPDQSGMKLIARIRDNNGVWYVTPEITGITLSRSSGPVRFYKPFNVPERMWARGDVSGGYLNCNTNVPDNLSGATQAAIFVRTWNGIDADGDPGSYFGLNSWTTGPVGANHYYAMSMLTPPVGNVQSSNTYTFHSSTTSHHGIEILWPGPVLMVRFGGGSGPPVPSTVQLASPANGTTGTSLSVSLRWNRVADATSYNLQVSANSQFSSLLIDDSGLADTVRVAGGLSPQTTYYWRVRGSNSSGTGPFSPVWSFRTFTPAPAQVYPPNSATGISTSLQLRWGPIQGATSYRLQVGTNPTFADGLVVHDSTLTDTTRNVSGLANSTQYYWRVSATTGGGSSGYSPVWSFTTVITAPGAVQPLSPADGAENLSVTGLRFTWRTLPGSDSYRFQLATDSTFQSGLVRNEAALADTSIEVSGLAEGTRHFWRVSARNAGGDGPFSPVYVFTTMTPIPGQVQLVSPPPGSTLNADSAVLSWHTPSPAGSFYWFELSTDSLFSSLLDADSTVADTFKVIRALTSGGRYYWRVRSGSPGVWGPFSETRSFSAIFTDVAVRDGLPSEFTLEQNYPNPFNPSTRIAFSIPSAAPVRLEVFSLLGERVALLLDSPVSAGYHTVEFDASALPSGVYYYRLSAGSFTEVKRMTLMK